MDAISFVKKAIAIPCQDVGEHPDVKWSSGNYEDGDRIVDLNLNIYRFSRCDDLETSFAILSGSNLVKIEASTEILQALAKILVCPKVDPQSQEGMLAIKIAGKLMLVNLYRPAMLTRVESGVMLRQLSRVMREQRDQIDTIEVDMC